MSGQVNAPPPDLVCVDINDFLSQSLAEKELILGTWLTSGTLAMIHAARGLGKSWFSLALAIAIASGSNYLGWKGGKQKRVLYVDGEMHGKDLQTRLMQLKGNRNIALGYLKVVTPDIQRGGVSNISTKVGREAISKLTSDVDVIFLDNLSCLSCGDENDPESWDAIQSWLLTMRIQNKIVIFIHHDGKTGNQRGTSKREDVLTSVIHLEGSCSAGNKKGARFKVSFEKSRSTYGEDIAPRNVELQSTDDGFLELTVVTGKEGNLRKVMELAEQGLNQTEIANSIKVDKSTVSRLLKQAREFKPPT